MTISSKGNELPQGWCEASLAELASIHTGSTPPTNDPRNYGGELPFLKPSCLVDRPVAEWEQTISEQGRAYTRVVPAGGVLVSCIGNLGKTGLVTRESAFNQQINAVVFMAAIDARYGFYACQCLKPYLESVASATTISIVNKAKFSRAIIRVPPLNEQRRIVAKIEELFSDLDAGVAALERVKINLKRYRASVLKAAVEGRLTAKWREQHPNVEPASKLIERILVERRKKWEADQFAKFKAAGKAPPKNWEAKYEEPAAPDTDNLSELPIKWCWATADQLCDVITDGEHITPPRTDSGIYLLSARNVLNGKLSLEDVDYVSSDTYVRLSKRLSIKVGDVLLSCSGTVGRSCVVPSGLDFSLVRSVAVLKPVLPIGSYMSFALRSLLLQLQINEKKTQTAQANIFQGKIKRLVFPLPPLEEQGELFREVEERLSGANIASQQIEVCTARSRRLRQSILKCAFEGNLVPQDPNNEPADMLLSQLRGTLESSKKTTTAKRAAKVGSALYESRT